MNKWMLVNKYVKQYGFKVINSVFSIFIIYFAISNLIIITNNIKVVSKLKKENSTLAISIENYKNIKDPNLDNLNKTYDLLNTEKSKLSTEIDDLEKDIKNITAKKLDILGTKWLGSCIQSYDDKLDIKWDVALNFENNNIICKLTQKANENDNDKENDSDKENDKENPITLEYIMSAGEINNEQGFMKLNSIKSKDTEKNQDDYVDNGNYFIQLISCGDKLTGIITDNTNRVLGKMVLNKEQ